MKQDLICSAALTADSLSDLVAEFYCAIRPERARLYDYYHNRQPIPKGLSVRGRPDNHLHVPFAHYITEVQTGYFLGIAPTMAFAEARAGQVFQRFFRQLQLKHLLFDIGRDLSICGAGFLLVWMEQSGLKACRCDPLSCFTVRSNQAGSPILGTVRLFTDADNAMHGVLYQADTLQMFDWDGEQVTFRSTQANLLRELTLIPFLNNCEGCGDFEMVTGLIDAYNLLLSGAMDDMQSVANAFLALYGLQATTQHDIDEANRTRVLSLGEGGKAEFVVKNLNQEALAQLENNLRSSILQLSMTPDLSDQSFSGNASGVALQYKLWGIEQIRSAKERAFTDGVVQLLEVLSSAAALSGSSADLSAGDLTFYKNLPQNQTELAETLLSLSPVLSQRTILEHLPWVADPEEELRRKAAENREKEDAE